jgi:hypothetical protein
MRHKIIQDKKELPRFGKAYTDKERIRMELKGLLVGDPDYDYQRTNYKGDFSLVEK